MKVSSSNNRSVMSMLAGSAVMLRLLPLLIVLFLPADARAQHSSTTNNGTNAISRHNGSAGDVTIPNTINGLELSNVPSVIPTKDDLAPRMELAVAEGAFSDLPAGHPRRNWAFDRAKEIGVTHIRGFVIWEKTPNGVYEDSCPLFQRWDSTIDEARRRGFEVELSLNGLASKLYGGDNRTGVDPDPREYEKFVTACAKHFNGRVHRYSVWNEPNHPVFLMSRPDGGKVGDEDEVMPKEEQQRRRKDTVLKNAKRYRELYDVGYCAIKAVDPTAQVLIGELSASHDPLLFLEAVAPKGTRLVADGFAHHPYQFAVAPDAPANPYSTGVGISNLKKLQTRLAVLAKAGRLTTPDGGQLPLYLTEFGYQRKEGRTYSSPSTQIEEAKRTLWLPKAFEVARQTGARQMLYFMLLPPAPDYPWDTSLLDVNGNPLPCYSALKNWAAAHGYATGGATTPSANKTKAKTEVKEEPAKPH
jgi:hypothetical protein